MPVVQLTDPMTSHSPDHVGLALGAGAYLLWGFLPLYWPLLEPAGTVEILAHRSIWSLVILLLVLSVIRGFSYLRTASAAVIGQLVLAGATISISWGIYVFAVNSGHVVESSLGYFMVPLVSVGLGVVVLRERLHAIQWLAVGIGVIAVLVLTVDYGHVPLLALVLAFTSSAYGFMKKKAGAPPIPGLAIETTAMTILASGYLIWLMLRDEMAFGSVSVEHTVLCIGAGAVTTIPLLCFAMAANRIPLSIIGLVQYVAPVMQFVLGVAIFAEHMPPARWFGFALVWLALVIFSIDAIRTGRRGARTATPTAEPVSAASKA